jgi:hypothetical protein
MPDIVDKANDLVSLSEELALREIRSMKPEAVFTGECLLCGEELEPPKRWCDVEHRDRWELERKRK